MTNRQIIQVAVDKLKPHPKNPYKHSPDQLKLLAKSITNYDWTVPIIANKDGTILSGHARWECAKFLKRKTVPVIYVDFTEKQALAYLIADNELTKKAELNFSFIADDLLELDVGNFDMDLTGLTNIEIEKIQTWTTGKNLEKEVDENIKTENQCPKCGYKW